MNAHLYAPPPESLTANQLTILSDCLVSGHFRLSSGRYTDVYFEKFRLLENPKNLEKICDNIWRYYLIGMPSFPDLVVGPSTGGMFVAYEVARQIGKPAAYAELENGVRRFRRGTLIVPGTRVLLVDDVMTTGRSLVETAKAITDTGADLMGVAVLVDRSERHPIPVLNNRNTYCVCRLEIDTFAEPIPHLSHTPITEPGSRNR